MVRSFIVRLLLGLASVIFTLLALEAGFRLFCPQRQFSVHVNVWDRELGLRQIPGAEGCIIGPEFKTEVQLNSLGLRDREYPYAKMQGTKRILCLGDSFTFGYGVQADQTFAKVLENLLNAADPGREHWEVINAGVCGSGTAHQLAYFQAEGYKLNPDLVLLCFCGANDFVDNRACGLFTVEDGRLVRHQARLSRPERLRTFMQKLPGYRLLFGRSHLVTFLKHRIARYAYSRRESGIPDPARQEARIRRGDELARRLILEMRDACLQRHASLLMMVVPEADGSALPERTADLVRYCQAEGIPLVDLSAAFREGTSRGVAGFYPIDGHWNANGHRLAAEAVFEFLMDARRNGSAASVR